MEINKCILCGKKHEPFRTNVYAKGTSLKCWIIECDEMNDINSDNWLEHRVSVYAETKEKAIERWNQINNH